GCTGTAFVNPNGLDTDGEKTLTTARDLAKISAELMKHERVYDYTTIWMDTVRNGEFTLANTNKLLKQYKGMTGLKTGYTSEAGFCISATARRDGMDLIAVVMAEKDKEARNADVTAMLNYGFSNYAMVSMTDEVQVPGTLPVALGKQNEVAIELDDSSPVLLEKSQAENVTRKVELAEALCAPVTQGQKVGEMIVTAGEKEIARRNIVAAETIEAKSVSDLFRELMEILLMKQ
ncbi:MAG: D-alanyl-D-alanine carboxypeptidase family protein, partial [Butyricicoccaceae bacterium]